MIITKNKKIKKIEISVKNNSEWILDIKGGEISISIYIKRRKTNKNKIGQKYKEKRNKIRN